MRDRAVTVSQDVAAWRELLKSKDFAWLWAGQVISQIGDGVSKIALLWFVYNMTGSALKMTIIGLLQTIPPLLLGPFAGVWLDRLPKRAAMIAIDLTRVVLLCLIPILYSMGTLGLTRLYVLVFLIALVSMAFSPALNAAIPLIAKREQLTTANALMQGSATIGQLFGPGLSGMLIAVIGAQNVLYVNAVTFLISALCKIPIHLPKDVGPEEATASSEDLLHDLRAGFRFVFMEHRSIFVLMIIAAVFNLGAAGFIYLLPVFGERVLHAGSVELGWLWSALSVGILMTTVWLAWKKQPSMRAQMWMIVVGAIVGGIAVFGLGIFVTPIAGVLLMVVIGGSAGLVTPIVSAALQVMTPKELLARVFSFFNTGCMAFAMLGMVVLGWAADHVGAIATLVGIGIVKIGSGIVTALLIPWCCKPAQQPSQVGKPV
jgi:MFS family permease